MKRIVEIGINDSGNIAIGRVYTYEDVIIQYAKEHNMKAEMVWMIIADMLKEMADMIEKTVDM